MISYYLVLGLRIYAVPNAGRIAKPVFVYVLATSKERAVILATIYRHVKDAVCLCELGIDFIAPL